MERGNGIKYVFVILGPTVDPKMAIKTSKPSF
jgi:hypothetical protein